MYKHPIPDWAPDARKVMAQRGMNTSDLAEAIGMTRPHVSSVLNGRVISPGTQKRICDYLGIQGDRVAS